jgi:two-component system, LuxR family, response regulator FixJ
MSGKRLVYIVDDDEAVRDSLELLLSSAGFETLAFNSAESFLTHPQKAAGGCLLSDIRMPGISGVELMEVLRARGATCPVVLITGHGDVQMAVEAMKRGAHDFIEKPFDDERLIGAISTALAKGGGTREAPSVDPEAAERLGSLSRRERQVMEGLVGGLSNKAIARDYGISPRTVEVYRANLMTKMHAASLAELVQIALRAGVAAD